MSAPKVDVPGMSEHAGFWRPLLDRLGKRYVKDGTCTAADWRAFSGRRGSWLILKAIMRTPPLLNQADFRERLSAEIIARPILTPRFMADIGLELRDGRPLALELWLHYKTPWLTLKRSTLALERLRKVYPEGKAPTAEVKAAMAAPSDKELADAYEVETGIKVSVKLVTRTRETMKKRAGK